MIRVCVATKYNMAEFLQRPCYLPLTKIPNIQWHVAYNNAKPLAMAYNYLTNDVLKQCDPHDIVLYMHDDVKVESMDIEQQLTNGLNQYDIVGLAGSSTFTLKSPCVWHNTPREHWSGTVSHMHPDNTITVNYFGPYKQVIVLDGLFIATTIKTLLKNPTLEWASYLPGFHFYDLDYSLKANALGLTMGTIHCPVMHYSVGNYNSPDWKISEHLFKEHWNK